MRTLDDYLLTTNTSNTCIDDNLFYFDLNGLASTMPSAVHHALQLISALSFTAFAGLSMFQPAVLANWGGRGNKLSVVYFEMEGMGRDRGLLNADGTNQQWGRRMGERK